MANAKKRILSYLESRKTPATSQEIEKKLDLSKSYVSKILNELFKAGKIGKQKIGKQKLWHNNPIITITGYQTNTGYDDSGELVDFEYEWNINQRDRKRLMKMKGKRSIPIKLVKLNLMNETRSKNVLNMSYEQIKRLIR